jgi:hypothetical protein
MVLFLSFIHFSSSSSSFSSSLSFMIKSSLFLLLIIYFFRFPAAPLEKGMFGHTLTLLNDGKVSLLFLSFLLLSFSLIIHVTKQL